MKSFVNEADAPVYLCDGADWCVINDREKGANS